jgi:transcriptional regulator with XRE-family HTH domain
MPSSRRPWIGSCCGRSKPLIRGGGHAACVDDRRLGMAVRARRHQRGWRLEDLAAAAGAGAGVCGLLERGQVIRLSVRTTRAILRAVDLPLLWDIGWQRQEIDRLLDADHASLAADVASVLAAAGWLVRSEVSFNHYGDRGRIDLLAFHPQLRVLLVIEIKTAVVDAQDTLGRLDVKARVAGGVASSLGWAGAALVVPALVIVDGTTARRHVRSLDPLFSRYSLRGHAALRWLRSPSASPPTTGILLFRKLPFRNGVDRRRAGRRRIRRPGAASRAGRHTSGSDRRPADP